MESKTIISAHFAAFQTSSFDVMETSEVKSAAQLRQLLLQGKTVRPLFLAAEECANLGEATRLFARLLGPDNGHYSRAVTRQMQIALGKLGFN